MTAPTRWNMVINETTGKCAAFDRQGNKQSGWYRDPLTLIARMKRKQERTT